MLIKFIKTRALSAISVLMKQYVVQKYGPKSDICIITGGPEKTLAFQTSNTHGLLPVEKHKIIRGLVGQNVLSICGVPVEGEPPPNIILIVTPSAIKVLGKDTLTFVNNWKGESMVGDIITITYSLN